MAKIVNLFNGGKKTIKTGVVRVNSRNVYPTTLVALPTTGLSLGLGLLDSYDFFNVAQTSASTDFIVLPNAEVGTSIDLYAISACKVKGQGSDTINGVAPSTAITLAASSRSILTRTTATTWILSQAAASGAATAPTS